jgi:hypothetical protein
MAPEHLADLVLGLEDELTAERGMAVSLEKGHVPVPGPAHEMQKNAVGGHADDLSNIFAVCSPKGVKKIGAQTCVWTPAPVLLLRRPTIAPDQDVDGYKLGRLCALDIYAFNVRTSRSIRRCAGATQLRERFRRA